MFSAPPPLGMKAILIFSPGTISAWMTGGVLSQVFSRAEYGRATMDLRR